MPPESRNTPEFKAKFLEALARNDGFVYITCREMAITSPTIYKYRNSDESFKQAWDDVVANCVDIVEKEAYKRAHTGEDEDVYYQGQIVGRKKNKSDALLMWYVNNKRGYANKQDHRIGGLPGAPPLGQNAMEFYPENLTPEERLTLAALLDKAQTKKELPPPAIPLPIPLESSQEELKIEHQPAPAEE